MKEQRGFPGYEKDTRRTFLHVLGVQSSEKCVARVAKRFYVRYSLCHIGVDRMEETVRDRVEKALEELRPQLQADGGDIELVEVENGIVKVKLKGACAGCPMSTMTLQWGVEQFLKKKTPEIARVQAV